MPMAARSYLLTNAKASKPRYLFASIMIEDGFERENCSKAEQNNIRTPTLMHRHVSMKHGRKTTEVKVGAAAAATAR